MLFKSETDCEPVSSGFSVTLVKIHQKIIIAWDETEACIKWSSRQYCRCSTKGHARHWVIPYGWPNGPETRADNGTT